MVHHTIWTKPMSSQKLLLIIVFYFLCKDSISKTMLIQNRFIRLPFETTQWRPNFQTNVQNDTIAPESSNHRPKRHNSAQIIRQPSRTTQQHKTVRPPSKTIKQHPKFSDHCAKQYNIKIKLVKT